MVRKLLAQTLETLRVARRRVDEQDYEIQLLRRRSTTDPATSLLNRRGLHLVLRTELARANRDKTGGALMVIDLDGFKAINDTYGHAAGDHVLTTVARFLHTNVRDADEVGRLGGDEFVVLMPGAAPSEADRRADALGRGLNQLVVSWEGRVIHVRGSIGGSCYGADDNIDQLFRMADEDMYRRKAERHAIRQSGGKLDG